jgi:hypothetical protein
MMTGGYSFYRFAGGLRSRAQEEVNTNSFGVISKKAKKQMRMLVRGRGRLKDLAL